MSQAEVYAQGGLAGLRWGEGRWIGTATASSLRYRVTVTL